MQSYSHFFQTLHDESKPLGNLGRGTHYSILRGACFHSIHGDSLESAHLHTFGIIWDEDHDTRVLEVIEKIYFKGTLSCFILFGERKGGFTAILHPELKGSYTPMLENCIQEACKLGLDADHWQGNIGTIQNPESIICDNDERVRIYLKNIKMLWGLGEKNLNSRFLSDYPHSLSSTESELYS